MESNMLRYFYITFPMISWLRLSFLQTLDLLYLLSLGSKSLEFKGVYAFESQKLSIQNSKYVTIVCIYI